MKQQLFITAVLLASAAMAYAQKADDLIINGNKLYRENKFDQSASAYNKAIEAAPKNPVASYNLGNAQFRGNHLEEAVNAYNASIENSTKKPEREKAYYNKGVVYSKEQKLGESIEAWKDALKLEPKDQEARENLQKALLEQKKQQQKENQPKEDKQKKKENQNQDKQKQQQPQQQQSKLSKKQVDQLLKALAQKEKEVQQKMQSKNASPGSQEKDW